MVTQNHGEFVYVGNTSVGAGLIVLSDSESHHLMRVRRARLGDTVMATDGRGLVYLCKIAAADVLEVKDVYEEFGESQLDITVVCGCLQGDTAREVVSTAVQFGARKLWWVKMAHSQEKYTDNKLDKLARVAIQATKQTGRARLLEQKQVNSLRDALSQMDSGELWVAHPDNPVTSELYSVNDTSPHFVFIGPEGGFAEAELEQLTSSNAKFVRLGSRRLRSEVAVAASLAYLLTKSDDF